MLFNQKREKFYLTKFAQDLTNGLGTLIKDLRITHKKIQIKTTPENLKSLLFFLHNHSLCRYTQLQEMVCVDTPKAKLRFTITYNLHSIKYNKNLTVSVQTNEVRALPTVTNIYYSANWLEREIWDLFGVFFYGHKDLRRILTDYGFQGHPLRKDFPLTGFFEIYYNDDVKRLSYEPVELAQEFRTWFINEQPETSTQYKIK